MRSRDRLGLTFLCTTALTAAVMAPTAGCGFRTDPNSGGLICVEADSETGEPELGTCENPIPMELVHGLTARGTVSGCSDTEGFCEANGPEQVFKMTWPGANDVTLAFNPANTDINPVMRVIEVPNGEAMPCDTGETFDELSCAPIVTDVPSRSFYTRGGYDYYVIVDSANGEAGDFEFTILTGWQETGTACLDAAEVDPIVLGVGGLYEWTAQLPEGHGLIGSGGACNAPGTEDLFKLQILNAGTLHVVVTATDGGTPPTLALRTNGCGGANQLACAAAEPGQTVTQLDYFFEGPANWNLVVDNPTDERVSYNFQAWLD